jgi:hypothetical protein
MKEIYERLMKFKSYLLYKHFEEDPGDSNMEHSLFFKHFSDITSWENMKNIKYKLEVHKKRDIDNFISSDGEHKDTSSNGLQESKMAFGKEKLIYEVVAEFVNKEGKVCKITLGLLQNPTSWITRNQE